MVYKMKSIITYDEIPLPKCMYMQKNINVEPMSLMSSESDTFRTTSSHLARDYIGDQTPSKEMTELVTRQEKVLLQLEQLQEHIRRIKKRCNIPSNAAITASSKKNINLPSEIVLNVTTDHFPLSLLLIKNVLAKDIFLDIKYHIHSTVTTDATKMVVEFVKLLQVGEDNKNKPHLNIRLIFKNVDDKMELITDSTQGIPIIGEVNTLRYLARLLPAYLPYPEEHETDTWLDACHLMQRLSTPAKEKQAFLKTVTANLERQKFLTGESWTITDVAVYSVLKNYNIAGSNTPFIQKWMQHVLTSVK